MITTSSCRRNNLHNYHIDFVVSLASLISNLIFIQIHLCQSVRRLTMVYFEIQCFISEHYTKTKPKFAIIDT